MGDYDSRLDTHEHIAKVRGLLLAVAGDLIRRAHEHDASKLVSPEVECFDEFTPKLRDSTYGSDEYKGFLNAMGEGLAHHYAANDHHPEHFSRGIDEMNLLQLIEMLCDWKAATLRHADGDIQRSITQNAARFGYGGEIETLLRNTVPFIESVAQDEAAGGERCTCPSRGYDFSEQGYAPLELDPNCPVHGERCPNCRSTDRAVRLVIGIRADAKPCLHPWHTCPTCGSDPETSGGGYGPCPNTEFHTPEGEKDG